MQAEMTDHYRISLEILYQLLKESDNNHWANWIAEDIRLWDSNKEVKHHLRAYGGMGSINDLFVGGNDKVGIWNNRVFDLTKNLSWNIANKRIDKAPITTEFYKCRKEQMSGWRCLNCGYSRLDENQIESFLSFEYLPQIISQLIQENRLRDLLPITSWIDKEEIEYDRLKISNLLKSSEIETRRNSVWLNECPKCKSENICVYRWELDNKKKLIIESNDNLKMKKNQHTTMPILNKGFIAKLKSWF